MASAKEQMKMIEAELERVRGEIEKLRVEEALLLRMQARMNGVPELPVQPTRTRSSGVKSTVLDIMREVGTKGATTIEVEDLVRLKVPTVADGTVGSVLARLKGDGALKLVNERYYEKQFAPIPEPTPFDRVLRAVI